MVFLAINARIFNVYRKIKGLFLIYTPYNIFA